MTERLWKTWSVASVHARETYIACHAHGGASDIAVGAQRSELEREERLRGSFVVSSASVTPGSDRPAAPRNERSTNRMQKSMRLVPGDCPQPRTLVPINFKTRGELQGCSGSAGLNMRQMTY